MGKKQKRQNQQRDSKKEGFLSSVFVGGGE
jgi:hypothetical protein